MPPVRLPLHHHQLRLKSDLLGTVSRLPYRRRCWLYHCGPYGRMKSSIPTRIAAPEGGYHQISLECVSKSDA